MAGTDIYWTVYEKPRFSAVEFGELVACPEGYRETKIRNARYAKDAARISYSEAWRASQDYFTAPVRRLSIIDEAKAHVNGLMLGAANPNVAERHKHQINALNAFIKNSNSLPGEGFMAENPSTNFPKLTIGTVSVSVYPTVTWRRARKGSLSDARGAIIVDFAKGDAIKTEDAAARDERSRTVTAILIHKFVLENVCFGDEVADAGMCSYFHAHRGRNFPCPQNYLRTWKDIEAVAEFAAMKWETVDPPPGFNPENARYK